MMRIMLSQITQATRQSLRGTREHDQREQCRVRGVVDADAGLFGLGQEGGVLDGADEIVGAADEEGARGGGEEVGCFLGGGCVWGGEL